MTPAGSGATGAACAVPNTAAKIKATTAIANAVRIMCLSLVYGTSFVARSLIILVRAQ
jgi:hypothetical protein